ncbi:MAG TPA: hypothetical protein VD967_00820 [Candidatus Paceibacterota bacterium]|nr:hypothetical protein [Candidatus Paceibacterota bacterium]
MDHLLALSFGLRTRKPPKAKIRSFVKSIEKLPLETCAVRMAIEKCALTKGDSAAEALSAAFSEITAALKRLASGAGGDRDRSLASDFCFLFYVFSIKGETAEEVNTTKVAARRRQVMLSLR